MAAAAVLLLAAPAATAQSDSDAATDQGIDVVVTAGLEEYVDPSQPVHFAVSLTSRELLVGYLEVTISGGAVSRTAVEVPAGGAKRFDLEAAAPHDARRAAVSLVRTAGDEDEEIYREDIQLRVPDGVVLVAVLDADGAVTPLRSASATPLGGDITTIAVDEPTIEAGLAPASYLVAGTGAVRGLGDAARTSLERWVDGGGRIAAGADDLAVIGEPANGSRFPGTSGLVARQGKGELIAVEDVAAVSVEEWTRLIHDPIPLGLIRNQVSYNSDLALVSAASTGRNVTVPALSWLLLGILLFVVMVGPVNFVVLRGIDRPELAWVTVPLLSVLFVAGFWTMGRSSVADFTLSHGSFLYDDGRVTEGESGLVVQVESGGPRRLALPEGWTAVPVQSIAGSESGVMDETDPRLVGFDLEDLGAGTTDARWQADPLPVDVAYHLSDDGMEVTVRNDTPWTWWAWGVTVNGAAFTNGQQLGPGESGTITARVGVRNVSYGPLISSAVEGARFDDVTASRYDAGYSLAEFAEGRVSDLRGADLYVFGFTQGFEPRATLDGAAGTAEGTTLLVKRTALTAETTAGFGWARPDVLEVSGAASIEAYYEEMYVYGADQITLRYRVPEGVTGLGRVAPGGTSLDTAEAWNWADAAWDEITWGDDFPLAPYTAPGGDLVIRGNAGADDFFEEALQLPRFALVWGAA
ncbi:MAG: hypothetical protein PVI35_07370 [Acidimicrobiia bacterium]|jgi:hypothetical protein